MCHITEVNDCKHQFTAKCSFERHPYVYFNAFVSEHTVMCFVTTEVSVCVSVSLSSEYLVVFVWQVVVGVCLLCEAVQDRMCVVALHFMCHFKNAFPLSHSLCLSLSFCFLSSSVSLSGLLCHLFQIPLSLSLFTLFFYPFIVTPGILCPVLFPSLRNQHLYSVIAWMLYTFSELDFWRFL